MERWGLPQTWRSAPSLTAHCARRRVDRAGRGEETELQIEQRNWTQEKMMYLEQTA
jgi:hypothetical protein